MHSQIVSDNGNFILLDMTVHKQRFTLVNLYGPNADNPNFYLEIFKKIEEIGNTEFIICGDFNLILDPEKDCTNYKYVNNPRAREKVLEFIESNYLTDPFRENHPEVKRYSWRKRNPLKQARLDFFLTSETITQFVQQSKIESSYRSDHSLVTLFLNLTGLKHGKSYWKHNNSLLLDQEYLKTMNKKITDIKKQYMLPVYNIDQAETIPDEEIQFSINDQLFLEVLLMELRGQSILYASSSSSSSSSSSYPFASYKNKQKYNREKELIKCIGEIEGCINVSNTEQLDTMKTELFDIRQEKLKGHIIRSKSEYIDKGEKPTKFFCGLEKDNYESKTMPRLEMTDDTLLNKQSEMLSETENYYKNLYTSKDNILEDVNIGEYIEQQSMNT